MFIPQYSKKPEEGDIVILTEDYHIKGGTFTKGHKFKVINKSSNGYILSDDDNNVIYNVSKSKISLIVSLEESRNDIIRIEKINKKLRIIESICPHRKQDWDEYEPYYRCKIDKSKTISHQCRVKEECEQFCDVSKLRKLKIEQLKDI